MPCVTISVPPLAIRSLFQKEHRGGRSLWTLHADGSRLYFVTRRVKGRRHVHGARAFLRQESRATSPAGEARMAVVPARQRARTVPHLAGQRIHGESRG